MANGEIVPCEGCGNRDPWARHHKKESSTGKYFEECNKCFDPSIPRNPDVYFKAPYWDENLHDFDDPTYSPQRGTYITSKAHKAFLMKKLHVRESGDRVHGATRFDPISHKHAMQSLGRK